MADAHANFAATTVATAPSPATSGTSLVVAAGDGAKFPAAPFNATICPAGTQPTTANAEIVRVTAVSTDTLTITRTQESTSARTVGVGDQIFAGITAKTLTDVEASTQTFSGFYGDGSDASPTFDGTTTILGMAPSSNAYTLSRDVFLASPTINSGVSIVTNGYRIFASGTLTNNGTIKWDGATATNATATAALQNTTGSISTATVGVGGTAGATANGSTAGNFGTGLGGRGGAGGNGAGGTGGNSAAASGVSATQGSLRWGVFGSLGSLVTGGSAFQHVGGGVGGSGGGGDGTNAGGAGGAGGGVIVILAKTFAGVGGIHARGGNGANGIAGNTGGGGGGGGGWIFIMSSSVAAGAVSGQTIDVNGGTHGNGVGTGTNGGDGSAGTLMLQAG